MRVDRRGVNGAATAKGDDLFLGCSGEFGISKRSLRGALGMVHDCRAGRALCVWRSSATEAFLFMTLLRRSRACVVELRFLREAEERVGVTMVKSFVQIGTEKHHR